MSKTKIVLDSKNVRSLLKSKEMKLVLEQHANKIKMRAGSGYSSDTYTGRNRLNVAVYPTTKEAIQDCYENNTLLKVIR